MRPFFATRSSRIKTAAPICNGTLTPSTSPSWSTALGFFDAAEVITIGTVSHESLEEVTLVWLEDKFRIWKCQILGDLRKKFHKIAWSISKSCLHPIPCRGFLNKCRTFHRTACQFRCPKPGWNVERTSKRPSGHKAQESALSKSGLIEMSWHCSLSNCVRRNLAPSKL